MRRHLRAHRLAFLGFVLIALAIVGCGGEAGSTGGPPGSGVPGSGVPGSSGSIIVTTGDAAAARVLTQLGRWPGLGPFDPQRIGQCCGYRVAQTAEGWAVTIQVGWDDCPAGCINRHEWRFSVRPDGTIVDQGQTGPPVPTGLPGAEAVGGSPGASGGGSAGGGPTPTTGVGIAGVALAGPTCPVQRPNDPACADRPVAGATVHVVNAAGDEVATVTTDAAGAFAVDLAAGQYHVLGDAPPGLMGAPDPVAVTVTSKVELVQLSYDTGIR
jgi:Carboxypeptidase regulatory-like domain